MATDTNAASTPRASRPGTGSHVYARLRAHRYAVAFALYALATCVVFWPLLADLDSTILHEPGDLTSTARDYWAAEQQGTTVFTQTHDRFLWAPEGTERAPSLQLANPAQPAFVLLLREAVGIVGALNLYIVLGFLLTAFVTFVLLDRLGFHWLGSFVGGAAFGFSWWQLEQAFYGHSGLNHLWILPLLLLGLLRLQRTADPLTAAGIGALVAVAFYLFSYLGVIAVVLVAVFMLGNLVRGRRSGALRRTLFLDGVVWVTAYAALFPMLLAAAFLPSGFERSFPVTKADFFGAGLTDYVLPSAHHPLFGRFVAGDGVPAPHTGESVLFFGYSTIGLAIVGAVVWYRRRRSNGDRTFALGLALLLVPIGIVLSLPAYATVAGHRVPLPDAAYVVGTVTNWWKIYSRFGVLVGLGLVILAAAGLTALLRTRRGTAVAAIAVAVAMIELVPGTPIPTWNLARTPASPVRDWLAERPGGTVAFYPMVSHALAANVGFEDWGRSAWQLVYDQVQHGHPLFAVPSLPTSGSGTEEIRLAATDLDATWTAGLLRREGVRYVVVNERLYDQLGLPRPRLDQGFRRQATVGEWKIYTPTAPPLAIEEAVVAWRDAQAGTPAVTFGEGFHEVEQYHGQPSRWMRQDGELRVAVDPIWGRNRYELVFQAFSNRVPRRVEVIDESGRVLARTVVGTIDSTYVLGPITLAEPVTLRLRTAPGPTLIAVDDTREASVYVVSAWFRWHSYGGETAEP
jgi:hypothetical protein